jgi:chitinase
MRMSRIPRASIAIASGVLLVGALAAPVGAQRLRQPSSSLVLATPTVACGVSPQINLAWTDSASAPTGTYAVMSKLASAKQTSWSAGSPLGDVLATTVAATNGTSWNFAIRATTSVTRDSNVVSVTVNCPAVDGQAPSVPTLTSATASSCSQVGLAWTMATDTGGSGLAGYNIWRNNAFVKRVNVPALSTIDSGNVAASTSYTY